MTLEIAQGERFESTIAIQAPAVYSREPVVQQHESGLFPAMRPKTDQSFLGPVAQDVQTGSLGGGDAVML